MRLPGNDTEFLTPSPRLLRGELERLKGLGLTHQSPAAWARRRAPRQLAEVWRTHASSGSSPSADRPPSTGRIAPLMKLASSDSRYLTAAATSSGRPILPSGCSARIWS